MHPGSRVQPRRADGALWMEEPIPATAFARVLKRLRAKMERLRSDAADARMRHSNAAEANPRRLQSLQR